ncbi:MAG TPA: hypothetical protein VGZ25_00275, partial [Gemmataceae bacterium]|nr:hypothetical protein [Gemmataceae bacterium]
SPTKWESISLQFLRKGRTMGHNRAGVKARARMKRRKTHEARLDKKNGIEAAPSPKSKKAGLRGL